jgi:hypothetical protein
MIHDAGRDATQLYHEALEVARQMPAMASRYSGDRPDLGFELESYPDMTLFRLERWATIQFGGALRLLERPDTAYVAEVVLRGLGENLAHVWWIQQGTAEGQDSRRCRALRLENGMALELVDAIARAKPEAVPAGSAEAARDRLDHMAKLSQQAGCKGKARRYGSVSPTLKELDEILQFGWLHDLWSVGSMVGHQGMLDRIMRDMGDGTTVVGEPSTINEAGILLERVTSVYGLIGRELLMTNSPADLPALEDLMGRFKGMTRGLYNALGLM